MSGTTTIGGGNVSVNFTVTTQSDVTITPGTANAVVFGGPNPVNLHGAFGQNLTFIGGAGAATVWGSTNTNDVGGSGSSYFVGGAGNTNEFVNGTGKDTLIAGTGNSTLSAATGSTGATTFYGNPYATAASNTKVFMNNGADTFVAGSGNTTVTAGPGNDVFLFVAGKASHVLITGFHAGDNISFGGQAESESVVGGSDVIKLADGGTITLFAVDHKLGF